MAALQGADIVCVPTNWVPIPGQDPRREAMANILLMAASHSNSIFIAAADRVGIERDQPFIGQSLITSYTGWPVAGPASERHTEIIMATVNLADAKRHRNWNDFNQVLKDRRPGFITCRKRQVEFDDHVVFTLRYSRRGRRCSRVYDRAN